MPTHSPGTPGRQALVVQWPVVSSAGMGPLVPTVEWPSQPELARVAHQIIDQHPSDATKLGAYKLYTN